MNDSLKRKLGDALLVYGYEDAGPELAASMNLEGLWITPRRLMTRYACGLARTPPFACTWSQFTAWTGSIRRGLAREYARFPYYKELGSFVVATMSTEQFAMVSKRIEKSCDRTGLHTNILLGVVAVSTETRECTGESTWGLFHSGRHFGAIREAVRSWCMDSLPALTWPERRPFSGM